MRLTTTCLRGGGLLAASLALAACTNTPGGDARPAAAAPPQAAAQPPVRDTIIANTLEGKPQIQLGTFDDDASAIAAWRAKAPPGSYGIGAVGGRAIAIDPSGTIFTLIHVAASGAPLRPPQ